MHPEVLDCFTAFAMTITFAMTTFFRVNVKDALG